MHPHRVAQRVHVPLLQLERGDLAREGARDLHSTGFAVVGVRELLFGQPQELAGVVADELAERAVDVEPAPIGGHERHPDRRIVEGAPKAARIVITGQWSRIGCLGIDSSHSLRNHRRPPKN
jgi:hypothetical protein